KTFMEGSGTRLVLNQVNATLNQGEFIVLLGQSGSGKSTLLNLLSGIEKPTTGKVLINGLAVNEMSERNCTLFRRDRIGFVFQFFNLIPTLTVLENVTLPQELAGKEIQALEAVARKLLKEVGLAERCHTFPDQLSGGQQQRVAIARALIHNPMLILADEPTGNLDEETGNSVLKLLLDLTRNVNKTLIMATHNPEIAQMADRVLQVHEGKLG
ncbi:MAG: ABC transporter ATP-binding protein, partial [Symploca sp. SIO3E6]|nr:ABC transporter ATP-binding protein [Caldora sp. SIO3E6]